MKTQKIKLDFRKHSLVELNENQLHNVNGGGTTLTTTVSTPHCFFATFVLGAGVYILGELDKD